MLDFKDAFMSIPLANAEKPYNCAVIPEGIALERPQLDSDEPLRGTCIVWNVLGFGGKPNPSFGILEDCVIRHAHGASSLQR